MKSQSSLKMFFSRDKKVLYVFLSILLVLILSLTIVYAALSVTLNIYGSAEVNAANWDIHLDNVRVDEGSVSGMVPSITSATTASFSTTLSNPGDYYMFTIDVVNDGSISAMIDNIVKMPELTSEQAKYIKYIVEYENGESVSIKQLVNPKSFVRLKVRVEYRSDVSVSDLPISTTSLDLSFKVNYVQSDDSGVGVENNGKNVLSIVNGDLDTVGSEVAIGSEHFYVISSDETSVTMLAKYNLHVGKEITEYNLETDEAVMRAIENPTGIQDSTAVGINFDGDFNLKLPWIGMVPFSVTNYWWDSTTGKVKDIYQVDYNDYYYVYDSNSTLYNYLENYKIYLENYPVNIEEVRLIKMSELVSIGCNHDDFSCSLPWVYSTSYWTGASSYNDSVWDVYVIGGIDYDGYENDNIMGVRPVVKVLKSDFYE